MELREGGIKGGRKGIGREEAGKQGSKEARKGGRKEGQDKRRVVCKGKSNCKRTGKSATAAYRRAFQNITYTEKIPKYILRCIGKYIDVAPHLFLL